MRKYHVETHNEQYWEQYYREEMLSGESSFCRFIKGKTDPSSVIVDVGCGSGRDTISFSESGYKAIGIDRSQQAIQNNVERGKRGDIKFMCTDICQKDKFKNILKSIKAKNSNVSLTIYGRFFLHSITLENQNDFLEVIDETLSNNDLLCLEFRTIEDRELSKVYNNHYRRYIDLNKLLLELKEKYRFEIYYSFQGRNLSIFKGENPYLGRIICGKKEKI